MEKHPKFHISLMLLFIFITLNGCGSGNSTPESSTPPVETTAKFAVLSDPHLYDGATLGTDSPEFIDISVQENKLLADSTEILSSAITKILSSSIDFVLVTGDLTKDGETASHELMATKLSVLKSQGKKVFVIPGNHDINNPLAFSYKTSPPSPVANISPAEFESIYSEYGYRDAISRDPNSLSYIAEPVPGMWLFALDSCIYANSEFQESPTTSGEFSMATRLWIIERLKEAKAQGKVVIGMMHHGILEHLAGQSVAFPAYILTDWQVVAAEFAENGLHIVFTGHFHAHDVTMQNFNSSLLYDIETGSLDNYPNFYRIAEYNFNNNEFSVRSESITNIPSHPDDFVLYAQQESRDNLREISKRMLLMPPYNLLEPTLSTVSQMLAAGIMGHFSGNEAPSLLTITSIQALIGSTDEATRELGQALSSLWTDLPPVDSSLTISLGNRPF